MSLFRTASLVLAACAILAIGLAQPAGAQEYRAFWVDAWGAGFLNQSQVDALLGVPGVAGSLGTIREANCNAVIVQVRRRADVCYPSGMGEPYFSSGLSPSNFNALQAMINAAHDTTGGKKRVEVHCWLVAFATGSSSTTPQTENIYWKHNIPGVSGDPYPNTVADQWTTLSDSGAETSDKALDPGHPDCLQYLNDVVMDMVNNFDIDGIHYDYIRFTANNQGYNPTSVARYNARYGLTGQPASTNEQFKQWRRDQVTALVRKAYANIQASKPWVKHSAAVVTWNPSPASSTRDAFKATRPYYDVYSDWDAWMQEGILDMSVPMTYYNQASLPTDFLKWSNFQKDRRANRFNIVGPGIYLNSLTNAINQLKSTRNPSTWNGGMAQGFCGYSYRVPYSGGTWSGFAPSLLSQVTPAWADVPQMPWKVSPTEGHIRGTVTIAATGKAADHAIVTMTGPENRTMYVDGTGFYAFIDLTPGTYTLTATLAGYPNAQKSQTVTLGEVTGNMYTVDLQLGGTSPGAPVISNVAASNVTNSGAVITWQTDQGATSQVDYGTSTSYGNSTALDTNLVTSHSQTLTGLLPKTPYNFRVKSNNTNGDSTSSNYTFTTSGAPAISNVQVTNIQSNKATISWSTDVPADSTVSYGLTTAYGNNVSDAGMVTSHSLTLTGLSANTTYNFKVASLNAYGVAQTANATFSTPDPATEIVVDNLDPGWENTSPNGNSWSAGSVEAVPKINTNYLYTAGSGSLTVGSTTRSCTWTADLPRAGYYDIYVFYQKGTNRNEAAPFTAYYDGGSVESIQNQNAPIANQGGWFVLAENVPCAAGTGSYVELSNLTLDTKYVSADAAKWVYKGPIDDTAPVMGVVTDESYTTSTTTLEASWSASDPESGIKSYEYAAGTTPGGTDLKDWTANGTSTSVTITGLSLTAGSTYYISARATNNADMTSAGRSSAGVAVAVEVPTIGDAKKLADGTAVKLAGKKVSAATADWTAVQEPGRSAGIRIPGASGLAAGQTVDLFGRLALSGNAERILSAPMFVAGDEGAAPKPLFLAQSVLLTEQFSQHTPGIFGGVGLSNQGLLVSLAGRVLTVTAEGFLLDDGSGCVCPDGTGIKVLAPGVPAQLQGTWQKVTGIASCYEENGQIFPQVFITSLATLN